MAEPSLAILGLFADEASAAAAVTALQGSSWPVRDAHGPIPGRRLAGALALPKSRVGLYTLCGGILGFFAGFALAAWTASQWRMMVSGKPIIALVPFFIVGFEFTILFAVFGNVLGLLTETKLPAWGWRGPYDARLSGHHFGVTALCPPAEAGELEALLRARGAVATVRAEEPPP